MSLPRRSWEWALSWQIYLRILKLWAGQWLSIETTYNVNNLYCIFIGGPIPAALDLLSPPFFPLSLSLWIRNSHHLKRRTKCPSTLWFSPSFRSPPLNLLSYSLSYPHVTIFVLFFFVLSQPASICIIIIPNSLTFHLFFLSFSSTPSIYFSFSLSNHTHSYTIHPTLLSSLHSRYPHSLVTTLSSPLIQPSRSGHQ